jgi:hypothetical protein
MHQNPVKRGLVVHPADWRWSSFRFYVYGEPGPVLLNQARPAVMQVRAGSPAEKVNPM